MPPSDLIDFLQSGEQPIYVGFSSVVIDNPEILTATVPKANQSVGLRAIISRGRSILEAAPSDAVFYMDDCPHEWLFQHVAAIVYHGGAGTTACALLHGRPAAAIPFCSDQPLWGNAVAACGAGPKPIPYRALNAANLANAIRFCLRPETVGAAQDMACKIQRESGLTAAVEAFYRKLPWDRMPCQLLPDQPASWVYHGGGEPIYLSKVAAQILVSSLRVKREDLEL